METPFPSLTAEQRARRDDCIAKATAAIGGEHDCRLEQGRQIRTLKAEHLWREHPDNGSEISYDDFFRHTFGFCGSRSYHLIKYADAHDELVAASVEPLTTVSHVEALMKDIGTGLIPKIVAHARERVEAEGVRLTAKTLVEARDGLLDDSTTNVDGAPLEYPEGLLVVVDSAAEEDIVCRLPSGVVVPFKAAPDAQCRATADPIGRMSLDPVADFAWPVLAPGPRETADAWDQPGTSLRATYFPGRLAMPLVRDTAGTADDGGAPRLSVVLLAPGVDMFHSEIPEPVRSDVFEAAGKDSGRSYLVLTGFPELGVAAALPANVVVCVEASTAEQVTALARLTQECGDGHRTAVALILRDCEEPVSASDLDAFAGVLLRGPRTTQAAFDSVDTLPRERLHVGPEVRPRCQGFPTPSPKPVRSRMQPAKIASDRRNERGVTLPPPDASPASSSILA